MDRSSYLNSVGWRGIRQRKVHLQELLAEAIRRMHADGDAVHILDIATGCGRYVLDTIRPCRRSRSRRCCAIITPANLGSRPAIGAEMGLPTSCSSKGTRSTAASLAAVRPAPNVAIVSGLYELFPENGKVLNSLRGLADGPSAGRLSDLHGPALASATGNDRPVLVNREQQPWIMRRRTQEELDELVRAAGFEKIAMRIDEDGIFTVSLGAAKTWLSRDVDRPSKTRHDTAGAVAAAPSRAARLPTLPTPIGLWKSALVWMFFCSLLFELVYDGCNWITAERIDVGTWYFAWEMRIPFVPAMIVPYWSLDLFFIGSFFVCSSSSELRILRDRLTASILIAGVCFLLFPLRLAFPRPDVAGVFGSLFAALRSFDQPYNLSPSLHIALRTIVYPVYLACVSPAWLAWLYECGFC